MTPLKPIQFDSDHFSADGVSCNRIEIDVSWGQSPHERAKFEIDYVFDLTAGHARSFADFPVEEQTAIVKLIERNLEREGVL